MKIALAADHAGFKVKGAAAAYLRAQGHAVLDFGADSPDSVDYPDYARKVAESVAAKKSARGVLLCGTGIGMSIAANKVRGGRAAVAGNRETRHLPSEPNNAKVLCLSAGLFKPAQLRAMIRAWLAAP